MRVIHNKTWACYENYKKPCLGALMTLKSLGYDYKVVAPLVSLDNWTSEINFDFERDTTFYEDLNQRRLIEQKQLNKQKQINECINVLEF